jgi:hypothetical protein
MRAVMNSKNVFLDMMRRNSDYSEAYVKSIYRTLVKEVHPDVSDKQANDFIKLKEQFEEAIKAIKNGLEHERKSTEKKSQGMGILYFCVSSLGFPEYKNNKAEAVAYLETINMQFRSSFEKVLAILEKCNKNGQKDLKAIIEKMLMAVFDYQFGKLKHYKTIYKSYKDELNSVMIGLVDKEKGIIRDFGERCEVLFNDK